MKRYEVKIKVLCSIYSTVYLHTDLLFYLYNKVLWESLTSYL